jgi:hypothetical protein
MTKQTLKRRRMGLPYRGKTSLRRPHLLSALDALPEHSVRRLTHPGNLNFSFRLSLKFYELGSSSVARG